MRPYSAVPELPTTRRCTCYLNCCAANRTSPRYRPRSAMSSSIFLTYVSGPSPGAYLFSSSTNTTTCCTPRSRFSRCSRSFVTTRAKIRSCASSSSPATSITYTVRSSKLPNGRSLVAPSSATSPLHRSEMLERRFRTLRIVATWCVRQLWSSFFSRPRSTSRNHASRSANDVTACGRSSIGSTNFLSSTFSLMKSISASAFASTSSLLSSTSAYCSTSRNPHVSDVTLSSSSSLERSVLSDTPSDLYGAKYSTSAKGSGATPHFSYSARSASSMSP